MGLGSRWEEPKQRLLAPRVFSVPAKAGQSLDWPARRENVGFVLCRTHTTLARTRTHPHNLCLLETKMVMHRCWEARSGVDPLSRLVGSPGMRLGARRTQRGYSGLACASGHRFGLLSVFVPFSRGVDVRLSLPLLTPRRCSAEACLSAWLAGSQAALSGGLSRPDRRADAAEVGGQGTRNCSSSSSSSNHGGFAVSDMLARSFGPLDVAVWHMTSPRR